MDDEPVLMLSGFPVSAMPGLSSIKTMRSGLGRCRSLPSCVDSLLLEALPRPQVAQLPKQHTSGLLRQPSSQEKSGNFTLFDLEIGPSPTPPATSSRLEQLKAANAGGFDRSLSDLELYKTLKGSSRAGEPQDVILGLCLPHTELENLIAEQLRLLRMGSKLSGAGKDIEDLATDLLGRGFLVQIRDGASEQAGHGAPRNCLRTLRHRFLVCTGYHAAGHPEPVMVRDPLIVEPRWKEQFLIANPTLQYDAIIQLLPIAFVGTVDRLVQAVGLLAEQVALAFRQQRRALPPWRSREAMLSKWSPAQILELAKLMQRAHAAHMGVHVGADGACPAAAAAVSDGQVQGLGSAATGVGCVGGGEGAGAGGVALARADSSTAAAAAALNSLARTLSRQMSGLPLGGHSLPVGPSALQDTAAALQQGVHVQVARASASQLPLPAVASNGSLLSPRATAMMNAFTIAQQEYAAQVLGTAAAGKPPTRLRRCSGSGGSGLVVGGEAQEEGDAQPFVSPFMAVVAQEQVARPSDSGALAAVVQGGCQLPQMGTARELSLAQRGAPAAAAAAPVAAQQEQHVLPPHLQMQQPLARVTAARAPSTSLAFALDSRGDGPPPNVASQLARGQPRPGAYQHAAPPATAAPATAAAAAPAVAAAAPKAYGPGFGAHASAAATPQMRAAVPLSSVSHQMASPLQFVRQSSSDLKQQVVRDRSRVRSALAAALKTHAESGPESGPNSSGMDYAQGPISLTDGIADALMHSRDALMVPPTLHLSGIPSLGATHLVHPVPVQQQPRPQPAIASHIVLQPQAAPAFAHMQAQPQLTAHQAAVGAGAGVCAAAAAPTAAVTAAVTTVPRTNDRNDKLVWPRILTVKWGAAAPKKH